MCVDFGRTRCCDVTLKYICCTKLLEFAVSKTIQQLDKGDGVPLEPYSHILVGGKREMVTVVNRNSEER